MLQGLCHVRVRPALSGVYGFRIKFRRLLGIFGFGFRSPGLGFEQGFTQICLWTLYYTYNKDPPKKYSIGNY